jgi:poly-gamma-glutamate synthase PgsB/CapB
MAGASHAHRLRTIFWSFAGMHLLPLTGCLVIFVLYLVCERLMLDRRVAAIPLRIAVTGTRGKSSVARMIASVLREDGRRVTAKTTGSQARIVLPDAGEVEVRRRGIPSIIEQKLLIRRAAQLKTDCLVAEVMSIHPENHYIESQQILRPHIVVITNFRCDHTEAMGKTPEEIAAVFCLDIPEKATVFVLERECGPLVEARIEAAAGTLVKVRPGYSARLQDLAPGLTRREFTGNLDLVCALADHLGIGDSTICDGIMKSRQDIGRLRVWKYQSGDAVNACYLVNGFAANDPESSLQVIRMARDRLAAAGRQWVGLLSLRADRADRTVQWIEALRSGMFACLSRIYITGAHSGIVRRTVQSAHVLRGRLPRDMMQEIMTGLDDHSVIVGLGNMKGAGELLVDFWSTEGEEHEL